MKKILSLITILFALITTIGLAWLFKDNDTQDKPPDNKVKSTQHLALGFKGDQSFGRFESDKQSQCHFGSSDQPLSPDGRFLIHQSGAYYASENQARQTTIYDLENEAGTKFAHFHFLGWSRKKEGFYIWDSFNKALKLWDSSEYKNLVKSHSEDATRHILFSQTKTQTIQNEDFTKLNIKNIVHAENGLVIFLNDNERVDVISLDDGWRLTKKIDKSISNFGTSCFYGLKGQTKTKICTPYLTTEELTVKGPLKPSISAPPITARLHLLHPDYTSNIFQIKGWEPRFIGVTQPNQAVALTRKNQWRCPFRVTLGGAQTPMSEDCEQDFKTGVLTDDKNKIYLQDFHRKNFILKAGSITAVNLLNTQKIITHHLYQTGDISLWQTHNKDGNISLNIWNEDIGKSIDSEIFCTRKPVLFGKAISATSHDGQTTYGYLFEQTGPAKGIVVKMHGGPHRAYPFYSGAEVQPFFDAGYHVIYSNYRGSPGHGLNYIKSGFGLKPIDMGRDAYALALQYKNKLKYNSDLPIHLFGGSWGGYAALASYHDNVTKWDSVTMKSAPCRVSSQLKDFIIPFLVKRTQVDYKKAELTNFLRGCPR